MGGDVSETGGDECDEMNSVGVGGDDVVTVHVQV